jgi:hypothetical protein
MEGGIDLTGHDPVAYGAHWRWQPEAEGGAFFSNTALETARGRGYLTA